MQPASLPSCPECGRPHRGQFGGGIFCSMACSKRVGARARWRAGPTALQKSYTHKSGIRKSDVHRSHSAFSDMKIGAQRCETHDTQPDFLSLLATTTTNADINVETGLVGEHVEMFLNGQAVVGVLSKYRPQKDLHMYVFPVRYRCWLYQRNITIY